MIAQHTPGSWTHDGLCIFAGAKKRRIIASVAADGSGEAVEERRANIQMMTAAPDLLSALILTLAVAQQFEAQASKGSGSRRGGPVFTKARAAIAKARGEA
jgi:hypothetical protein